MTISSSQSIFVHKTQGLGYIWKICLLGMSHEQNIARANSCLFNFSHSCRYYWLGSLIIGYQPSERPLDRTEPSSTVCKVYCNQVQKVSHPIHVKRQDSTRLIFSMTMRNRILKNCLPENSSYQNGKWSPAIVFLRSCSNWMRVVSTVSSFSGRGTIQ